MKRLAIKVAYRGDGYFGSQIQPSANTVEGDILKDVKALCDMTDGEISLSMASRTDKGVNALGNVAVFHTNFDDPEIFLKALNCISENIYYRSYAEVNEDFNPRFADSRSYRYIVPRADLDISKLTECAKMFEGEHDFCRFCRSEGKPTRIRLESVSVKADGDLILIEFDSRFYLWNMIRRIAAAVILVAEGRRDMSEVADALNGKDITFGLARADALTLTDVAYKDVLFRIPEQDGLRKRVDESLFKEKLNQEFFESLKN